MNNSNKLSNAMQEFLDLEAAGGVLLMVAVVLAMIASNSLFAKYYNAFLDIPVSVQVGPLILAKPLLLWINDGLMAIFFFLIGLEVKREILEGELSDFASVAFPGVAAIGGMVVPAAIFYSFNYQDSEAMAGWAIPLATDIAFALGLLAMFGKRVPPALKLFLLSLAIFDDLGAIAIIAVFYTADLSAISLGIAIIALAAAVLLNRKGVLGVTPYVLLGLVMWICVLKSGVHATLAGVALAFTIPLRVKHGSRQSPLKQLEHDLHGPVAYVILPIFAFANAGVALAGMELSTLVHPVTLGVAGGLVLGKFVGVLGFAWLGAALKIADKPSAISWGQVAGVAALCGVGFTMSLFIAGLAYEQGHYAYFLGDRLGILLGSGVAAVLGVVILAFALPKTQES